MQSIDYRFNIRGQLLTLNNSTLSSGSNNSAGGAALYGIEYLYDKVDAGTAPLSNTPYYNGMVSAVKWMANTSTLTERSYTYTYDDQNRLQSANYADRVGTGAWGNTTAYDEKAITYDYNGNITTLQRNTILSGSTQQVDNLTYTYNGNQLNTVADGSGSNYTGFGFRNMTGTTTGTYVYDVNGNMTTDPYKGMTLDYNVLNRTNKITITTSTGRFINYTYDANGVLLKKQQYDNSTLQTTTDYVDGFVVVGGTLSYLQMPEGRVINSAGTYIPEYFIADQQGNVRMSFQERAHTGLTLIKQENSYYPFGLIMPNSQISLPTVPNKQLYNGGSEWQNDYGNLPDLSATYYRNYDAALARFVAVDPEGESAESMTPYQYAGNNPVMFNDPMGDQFNSWAEVAQTANTLLNSQYGGTATGADPDDIYYAKSDLDAFASVDEQFSKSGSVGYANSTAGSFQQAFNNLINHVSADSPNGHGVPLNNVTIQPGNYDSYVAASQNIHDQVANTNLDTGFKLFGTTLTTEDALSIGNSNDITGKYLIELKYTQYSGLVNDEKKGLLNFNTTRRNGEVDHDVSLDVGKFSFAMGLTSRSIGYDGYTFNFNASILSGITFGVSHTGSDNKINGSEYTINPFKIIPAAVGAAYTTAPYWLPVFTL